jgi:DNA-binding NtrC family response regulator
MACSLCCRRLREGAHQDETFEPTTLWEGHDMKDRVLIADDEEHARSGLASLLATWGYEVEEAVDGTDALERASEFHPNVVIADVVMPGVDGLALLKSLADVEPAAAVILLTGHATVESAVSAMKEGAYDYLTKPVDP